jgi:hypothetical protein
MIAEKKGREGGVNSRSKKNDLMVLYAVTSPLQVTRKNCNHYSDALCQRLVGASVPAWVNRPARIGSIFSFGGNKDKAKEKNRTEKVSARTKAENAAAKKKKELTEDQKKRLAAIRRTSSSS